MHNIPFKKKLTAQAIASVCLLGVNGMAFGQALENEARRVEDGSPGVLEEVVVTGIRSSLQRSMDVKRTGQGVVDALSAEDIGKMPDTNLAEALQRVTGVSIDRVNGEGSKVTVRGFGPDYNVITLNGRQMPAANLEDTTASSSRSFDFAQLAAESVRSVEIYKTGRADLQTGGIGSVINIGTTRPLEVPERVLSFSAKAHHDTTNEEGDDYTPEISGIYSDTFADGKFGVAISGSYSERDSGYSQGGTTSGWYTIAGGQDDWGSISPDNPNFENAPQAGDTYSVPRNINYAFGQVQRERTNALLTLQWEPIESVTATLDYAYSEFDVEQQVHDMGAWFNGNPTAGSFTEGCGDGCVVAPVIYEDSTGNDVAFGAGDWGRKNELNSVGINIEWRATDRLTLEFDYHDSDAENKAKDDRGTNNIITAAQYSRNNNRVDYSKDLPVLTLGLDEPLDPSLMLSSGTSFRNSYMKHTIKQGQINGLFTFEDSMVRSIDFGVSYTDSENHSAFSNAQRDTWGGYGTAEDFDDSLFTRSSLPGQFDELSGAGNPALQPYYYEANFKGMREAISAVAMANGETISPCGTWLCADPLLSTDRTVKEEQTGAYAQVNFAWEDVDMPMHLTIGLRYEDTDVDSTAEVPQYNSLVWAGDNEFTALASGTGSTANEGSYTEWLPNIDFDIEVVPDVVLRGSSSITITRPK